MDLGRRNTLGFSSVSPSSGIKYLHVYRRRRRGKWIVISISENVDYIDKRCLLSTNNYLMVVMIKLVIFCFILYFFNSIT